MASTTESQANTILILFVVVLLVLLFWEPIAKMLGIKTGAKVSGGQAPANPTEVSDDGKGKCTVYNADGSQVIIEGNLNDPQFEKLCRDSNLNYDYPIYYYGYPYYTFFGSFGGGRRHHHHVGGGGMHTWGGGHGGVHGK